jgi:hypothetical protein
MNTIMLNLVARPAIGRLLLLTVAILVTACNNSGGKPGY